MNKLRILMVLNLVVFVSPRVALSKAIPQDALDYLKSIPGQTLSLDFVIARAIQSSDSYRIVQSKLPLVEIPDLQASAPLDPMFKLSGSLGISENEPATPYSASRSAQRKISLGLSKLFVSGTTLQAELSHGNTDLTYAIAGNPFYYETIASLELKQNLWKDFLGRGTRMQLESGEKLREASVFGVKTAISDWTYDVAQFYYGAWLAQSGVRAATSGLAGRERLLKITQLNSRRGTAEKPDLLQVQSAVLLNQVRVTRAKSDLDKIWKDLVYSLKFPAHWAEIDPVEIPMKLDDPIPESLVSCQKDITENFYSRQAVLENEAAQLRLEAAKDSARPDLKLGFGLTTNGIDTSSTGTSFSEAFQASHPAWKVTLELGFPLFHRYDEARFRESLASSQEKEAKASIAQSNLKVQWVHSCETLKSQVQMIDQAEKAFQNQSQRAELEEKRFQIGRTQLFNVIQAGDDAIQAELDYHQVQINARKTAWEIRRISDQIPTYLENLEKRLQ